MQPTKYQITATDGAAIFAAFAKWINQRPGLDPRNYFSTYDRGENLHRGRSAYTQEAARIAKDGREARAALKAAQFFPFDPTAMQDALDHAYSGRLQWDGERFDYCTGQYWPTEYRNAAAAVLKRYVETVRPKVLPGGKIPQTVQEIKAANYAAGGHYFDRDTMRFFRSRIVPGVHVGPGGVFFVTSEQYTSTDGTEAPRRFTVRGFDPQTGDIRSVGEFNKMTRGEAIRDAKERAARKQVAA